MFAFTVSGAFDEWRDIAPETFICDTRKREDRSCFWQGHVPEISRNIGVYFKPFPHDQGMYKIKGQVEHNLGRDLDYQVYMGLDDAPEFQEAPGVLVSVFQGVSITHLAQYTLKAETEDAGRYRSSKRSTPFGYVTFKFKEVLK